MTVYNRKMFRKKGGGASGIMASGTELIKAQSGVAVNLGGGASKTRGGFPSISAFSAYEPPIVPSGLGAISLNPTGADLQSGKIDIIGKDRTRSPSFLDPSGKTALEQLAETESAIGRQVGPFSRNLSASQKLPTPEDKPTSYSDAYKSGFRDLGTGITKTIAEILDPDVEDISEDVETPKTKENKVKEKTKVQSPTIKAPSEPDDLIKKLDISPESSKQGDGIEKKGKTKANVDKEGAKIKYDNYTALMKNYLGKNDDENAANATLKAHGYKDDDIADMSAKEKVDEVRGIITEVMGTKDPSKDQGLEEDLKAMNIVMLGLSIAAGDSPDALTNIANGAKEYVLRRSKQIKEKRDEEKQLDLLALKTVLGREDKKLDQKFQMAMSKDNRKHDLTLLANKNVFEMMKLAKEHNFKDYINTQNIELKLNLDDRQSERHTQSLKTELISLTENLKVKTEIANAQLQQSANIANMDDETKLLIAQNQLEANELRTIIGNLPQGYGFAMIEGKKKGLEGDALVDYAKEKGQVFAKNPYLTGPDSFRRMVINVVPKIMKEDGVTFEKALENLSKSIQGNDEILKYFPELEQEKINKIVENVQKNKPKTVGDLGLNANPGDVLGQDGKPYTGTGPKFIVQNDGTVVKG